MEKACKFECPAEKEGGHNETYLTFVHQADGFSFWRYEVCGWIKPITEKLKSHNKDYVAALEVYKEYMESPDFMEKIFPEWLEERLNPDKPGCA